MNFDINASLVSRLRDSSHYNVNQVSRLRDAKIALPQPFLPKDILANVASNALTTHHKSQKPSGFASWIFNECV